MIDGGGCHGLMSCLAVVLLVSELPNSGDKMMVAVFGLLRNLLIYVQLRYPH